MSYIVDFFKSIGDIISHIVDFIKSFVESLIQFITMIPEYAGMIGDLISELPPVLVGFASATLAAALIFVIIGRRGK